MIFDLKTYRIAHGFTQQEIGDILKLKKSAVSMIESGKRTLPDDARNKLYELQRQAENPTNVLLKVGPEPFYKNLKAEHQRHAEEYIRVYLGDLQSEKHRLEKLLKSWTAKFIAAGMELKYVEIILINVEQGKFNYDAAMPELLSRKMIAEDQLREVTRQKPEIAMIRLEGIKKELSAGKTLLGKRQMFPVIDSVSISYAYMDDQKQLGAAEKKKELPGGE